MQEIPVIDLFAGPGGLSHGFSTYKKDDLSFSIRLSVENNDIAHRTLLLRSFLRQFSKFPAEYYAYMRGETGVTLDTLAHSFPRQWEAAKKEAKKWTLGSEPFGTVSQAIRGALGGASRWILLGGPPCQAYSLAGRSRMKNEEGFSTNKKHTLYREYLKIVAVHQPTVFVMENVKGILSSKHEKLDRESIFHRILDDLRDPGSAVKDESDVRGYLPTKGHRYRIYSFVVNRLSPDLLEPNEFVVHSEDWGIPQRRHRVILLGVRADVVDEPQTLADLFHKEAASVEDVLKGLPVLRSKVSKQEDSPAVWRNVLRKLAMRDVISKISDDAIRRAIKSTASTLKLQPDTGSRFKYGRFKPRKLSRWLYDPTLKGVAQHQSRSHMREDLVRYFFAACAAKDRGYSLKLSEYPTFLLPKHKNAKSVAGKKRDKEKMGMDFDDRFRVQLKNKPSTTITSHISKDGHYYIHYDPTQCRSLTVREAARLQTFPDSYFFEGNRTQQYHQVGNAVPPLLARKLAFVVADLLMRVINTSDSKR